MFLTTSLAWLSIRCILGTLAEPQIVINPGSPDLPPGSMIGSFVPVSVISSDLPPLPVIISTPAPVTNQRSGDVPVETVGTPVMVGSSAPVSLPPGVVAGPAVMASVPAASLATLESRTPVISPPSAISAAPPIPQSLVVPQAAILTTPAVLLSASDPLPVALAASNPPPAVAPASTSSAPVAAAVASNPPPAVAPASTSSAPAVLPSASDPLPVTSAASNAPPAVAPASTSSAPVAAAVASNPPPAVAPASTSSAPVAAAVASNPPPAVAPVSTSSAPAVLPSASDPLPVAPAASNPPPAVVPASTSSAPVAAAVASNPPPVVAPASNSSASAVLPSASDPLPVTSAASNPPPAVAPALISSGPVLVPVVSDLSTALFSITASSLQPVALPSPTASSSGTMESVLPANRTTTPVGTHEMPGYQDYLVKVLAVVPSDIRNQAPKPSITVAYPLISSFPPAKPANPVSGRRKEITYTTPGTNVSIVATLAGPQDAPTIDPTTYEYTIGSMRYYIAAQLNATGDLPLGSSQDPFFWDIGYGAWCEFNSNPDTGPEGPHHLTYGVVVAALDGIKLGLLLAGWYELAFVEIGVAGRGVVGMALVAPNLAPYGSPNVENVEDAFKALGSVVQGSPVYGGEAH
ncbi:hypothetical protein N7G274_009757 [Stereocaulon virgatum]|uniref:Uncharacterized protein n=1 Tax=Stereocaulon virgatum TaxID=373712 RepID=A0ABR3ZXQ0_9LECA